MIHSTADVQSKQIGINTYVWQYVVILPNASIGDNCNINAFVFIENDVVIGNNVTIKSGVQIWDSTIINDNVFVGPNVTFTNDVFPQSKKYKASYPKTILHNNCSIGANSTLLPGIEIGEFSLIGAGSVVTKSVEPYTIVTGAPATFKRYLCKCQIESSPFLCDKCDL